MSINTQLIRIRYALESLNESDREELIDQIEFFAAENGRDTKIINKEKANETAFLQ